jgi:integrase
MGAPGRHNGPRGLPARPAGLGLWTCGGTKSSLPRGRFTYAGSSRALPAPIRSSGTSFGRYDGSSGSKSLSRPSCSHRSAERAGAKANLALKAHPHMLRHACGYSLANRGHDTRALQAYLGHRNIQHTVRYTELSPTRFKNFWRE